MKVGFIVNDIRTEEANYTTTHLAMAAVNRGHEAWLIGTGDLAYDPDDYVVAQEYLAAAAEGDTRLFMMNGQPLRHKGKYAAFRRLRQGDDIRSNIHAGGVKAQAVIDDQALHIAEIVRPKLVEDGMFFVGLDIVGDKLMEINVFSPGGLGSARQFENVNFAHAVIEALERKVNYMGFYRRNLNNIDMATL